MVENDQILASIKGIYETQFLHISKNYKSTYYLSQM